MPQTPKIATCCYCGTRAALVFKGAGRHELACSACGAPLHELKQMPSAARKQERVKVVHVPVYRDSKPPKPKKKKKRRKSWSRRFAEEFFDVVEDIFD
jgi:transcription initiation factor IIE alpha subunit